MLGLNFCFYDFDNPTLAEPILVAARLTYKPVAIDLRERNLRGWDTWYAFLVWNQERRYNEAMVVNPKKRATIERVMVAAAPVFSIRNLESASALVDLVGVI